MNNNIIYGLVDPITDELRYIGQSSIGIKRPLSHSEQQRLRPEGRDNRYTHKQNWILQLRNKYNLKPSIIILEYLECREDLNEAEIFFIQYFKSLGCRLTNLSVGGNQPSLQPRKRGWHHTKEVCAKMNAFKKGHIPWNKGKEASYSRLMQLKKIRPIIPVIDSNGVKYESLSHAAKVFNCTASVISKYIKFPHRNRNGITFKKAA